VETSDEGLELRNVLVVRMIVRKFVVFRNTWPNWS